MSVIRNNRICVAKGLGVCIAWITMAFVGLAQSISTTTVQGTVYLANGAPGSGTLQVSWPAFTTASNQAVTAGKITANIGADGFVSVNLAANLGSSPAGLFYTAIYHLSDGTVSTEYWVVPAAAQASIGQVRSQVMPAAQAAQAVSKAYVDQAIQSVAQGNLSSVGGQLTGPLYLTGDPTQSLQAADKHYVDATVAQALPLTGGTLTGPLTAGQVTARNNADSEADYILWPGTNASQKGSFIYKDFNGSNQWQAQKDANNDWALNSSISGLDSLKAYQSTNSGDTYINASKASGAVRINYETGSGSSFNVYGGNSSNLYASFAGANSIKFPGLSASSGTNCLQVDASGFISNTGSVCTAATGNGTVNSGLSGQIAYYPANGAAVSGMSTVPVSAGGTGASTAAGALTALGGVSLLATTAQTLAGSIIASVNNQFNVMAYGAKGDCVNDDHNAITSAMTAAAAFSPSAVVYFPKPPGGCYLTSTLTYTGVTLLGQPSGHAHSYNTLIKGKPGYDVFNVPDPGSHTLTWNQGWSIKDITIQVDNSIAPTPSTVPNLLHRWPGRWFDDAAMTAGSAVLKTTFAAVGCGDVGQAVQVNGAGPGGANLVTTITSVNPCFAGAWSASTGWQMVTLAATASTTVSNAHAYISILGLPVTSNVGNCGIAWDNLDGNPANWQVPNWNGSGNLNDTMDHVNFISTSGANGGNACALYTQGAWGFYSIAADNIYIYGIPYGVVQGPSELNSWYQSTSNDFQTWRHGAIQIVFNPWISYNGSNRRFEDIELTAQSGPQFLSLGNKWADGNGSGVINIAEFENQGNPTIYGLRTMARGDVILASALSGGGPMVAYIDGIQNKCIRCTGNMQVGGVDNEIEMQGDVTSQITDVGRGNHVTADYSSNPLYGVPYNYKKAMVPSKGIGEIVGSFTGDFLQDGYYTTPYNRDDLFIFPQDVMFNGYGGSVTYGQNVVQDASSASGAYLVFGTGGSAYGTFSPFAMRGNTGTSLIIGTVVPASGANVYYSAKCPAGTTSFTFQVALFNGGPTYAQTNFCTTSYQTYKFPVSFTGYAGYSVIYQGSGNTFNVGWIDLVPFKPDFNGFQPQPWDGTVTMNALNWKWGSATTSSDASSPVGYSTNVWYHNAISSANNSASFLGGQFYPATPSKVTFWTGAPSVFTDTLNGAITNAATSIALNAATTSTWGSSGYLLLDQEVVQYTGVSAGLTTITVNRGQYGTLAQAHNSGVTAYSIGTGQMAMTCNGANQALVNVLFMPTFTPFSGEFSAQNCSGYSTQIGYVTAATGPTGQQYNVAQIQIAQETNQLNVPTGANIVPVSGVSGGMFAYNTSKPLAGSGAGITTGPTSGTVANHLATFGGTTGQIQDSGTTLASVIPLSGTTASIGGSALAVGACVSGTVNISGATTSMVADAGPVTYPGDGMVWESYVSSSGIVTVKVCAVTAGTPTASAYNVRVIQ